MRLTIRSLAVLFALALIAMLHACDGCEDGDEDDADDCSDIVAEPITDCESICNEDTCAIVQQCDDYIQGGAPENCVSECLKGCAKGCVPVGAAECIDGFTDCEALIACLEPSFTL
ncbi:hypothetical protein K8I61_19150 [bacterium]|nr:hypothetical protein [bacterium]